ncbi:dihydroorotate dehydrogenase electron transfer subunit [Planctomycetaceae bacterium]|nr:dihydroorotate dehydrogenase electron transfer subunit [Planctomycetaceae bacterium]
MAERAKLLHDCIVTKVADFGLGYFELILECPELAVQLKAGQFVNVRVRDELYPLLRRPFSSFDWIADVRGRATGISILGHVVGQGTALMAKFAPGSKVSINGPLGKPFEPPAEPATRVILVGGGIGLAPFLHVARQWPRLGHKHELALLAGARSKRDFVFMKRFAETGIETMLATEDGSAGVKGKVTVLLEAELKSLKGPAMVFTCGPWRMMQAVSDLSAQFKVPCYASLERTMGCGYGVCNGCVAKVKCSDEPGYRYAKTCVEGTVMDGASLVW